MKKINKLGYIAVGMVLALIISTVTPAFAASKDIVKQITAYFTSGGKQISLVVNGTKIEKDSNGKAVTPMIIDGVTYVPVRAAAESCGKEVIWDGANATVKINDMKLNLPGSIKDENAKLTTTIDAKGERHDNLEYTFTLDKNAVGDWLFYDSYAADEIVSKFNPNDTPHSAVMNDLIYSIYNDGKMALSTIDNGKRVYRDNLTWTKGYFMGVLFSNTDITSAYAISTISGKTFMVMERKTGDYIRTGNIPNYFVFIKTSDTPTSVPSAKTTDSKITVTKNSDGIISETMDYKFESDKDVLGQWEQIDFVASPEDFDSTDITRRKYVGISIHNFYDNGKMISYVEKSKGAIVHQWTKGYILGMGSNDTISGYEVRQLNGKTFMFVEWKSGDYTNRGQKPNLYVFVKTSDTPDPDFAK